MAAAAATCTVAAATALELQWLLRWPVPVGRDGYYYVLQVRSLLAHGTPYYATFFQWPLWFMAGCVRLANDPIVGNKIAVAIAFAAVLMFTYSLVREVTGRSVFGLVSVVLLATSPLRQYFLAEFSANLVGIAVTAATLAFVAKAEQRLSRRRLIVSAAALSAALSSHPSASLVLGLAAGSYWCVTHLWQSRDRAKRSHAFDILLAAITVVAMIALMVPDSFTGLAREFKLLPIPTFRAYSFWPEALVLLAACVVLVFRLSCVCDAAMARHRHLLLSLVAVACSTALNPWARYDTTLTGTMERLGLWSWFFVAVLIPAALASLDYGRRRERAFAGSLALCAIAAALTQRTAMGATERYLSERTALRAELPILTASIPHDAVVMAEHGTEFMVTAEAGLHAQSRLSSDSTSSAPRYWLLRTAGLQLVDLPHANVIVLSEWVAIREDSFFRWMTGLSPQQRRIVTSQNRLLIDPLGIRWRSTG